jgi:hypothetical protein
VACTNAKTSFFCTNQRSTLFFSTGVLPGEPAPTLAVGLADKATQGLTRLVAAQTVQINLAL